MGNIQKEASIITCKLVGLYSYAEVMALNKLTGFRCGEKVFKRYCEFGHCQELGNVAFIGLINSSCCAQFGSLEFKGTSTNTDTIQFELYSNEAAEQTTDYTVYVLAGAKEISAKAPVEQNNKPIQLKFFRK